MDKNAPSKISLETFWPYQIVVLADRISRNTARVAKAEAGLNLSQWRVLAAAADKPGRTAAQVTAVTPMDKTIVSRAVRSLIDGGLLEKSQAGDDKRRLILRVTPAGLCAYGRIAARLNASLSSPNKAEPLPDDFIDAVKTLTAHMKNLSPDDE